jgi:hypothetical protein
MDDLGPDTMLDPPLDGMLRYEDDSPPRVDIDELSTVDRGT